MPANEVFLRFGLIKFYNFLPVRLGFEKIGYKLFLSDPATLNKMLLNNELDIATISSVTWINNQDLLKPILPFGLSCYGPVMSTFLISDEPIEALDKKIIKLSNTSNTINTIVMCILRKFYKIEPIFSSNSDNFCAQVIIGDDALNFMENKNKNFIYDVSELWRKHTNLPTVFSLLAARKDIKNDLLLDFIKVYSLALKFAEVEKDNLDWKYKNTSLKEYYSNMSYILDTNDLKGLFELERLITTS
ncbi:menaquinone biosynthesis protein [Thermodesulfobium sp.]|jgi:chorismate dehydratase